MEERYWLQHPSLRGLLGPYHLAELRTALAAGSLPADSYVLPDSGQDETALRASPHWRPVADVLGLPRPPKPPEPPPPLPSATELAHHHRQQMRTRTAYALPRRLVAIGAGLGMLAAFLTTSAALIAIGRGIDLFTVVVGMGSLAWEIAAILVVAALLHAVFDIADCSLQGRAPDQN